MAPRPRVQAGTPGQLKVRAMKIPLVVALLIMLAACSPSRNPGAGRAQSEAALVAADAAAAPSGEVSLKESPSAPATSGPMLAYSYNYSIVGPPAGIRQLGAKHEAACTAAGPALCQVMSSSRADHGPDGAGGAESSLSLRAEPRWLAKFRAAMSGEATQAGGRLVSENSSADDLSRAIVDTSALLRAKTTLRDRLQALLASHPGKLSDLLEVDRALSEVQAEIDTTTSELAMMQGRVDTSALVISYSTGGALTASDVWHPLGKAFADFTGIVASTLASMVRLLAWTLPWIGLIAGILWLFRRRLPKFSWPFSKKPKTPAA